MEIRYFKKLSSKNTIEAAVKITEQKNLFVESQKIEVETENVNLETEIGFYKKLDFKETDKKTFDNYYISVVSEINLVSNL